MYKRKNAETAEVLIEAQRIANMLKVTVEAVVSNEIPRVIEVHPQKENVL